MHWWTWWMVYALAKMLCWCLFHMLQCNKKNKHQNNDTQVIALTNCLGSAYFILLFYKRLWVHKWWSNLYHLLTPTKCLTHSFGDDVHSNAQRIKGTGSFHLGMWKVISSSLAITFMLFMARHVRNGGTSSLHVLVWHGMNGLHANIWRLYYLPTQ